MLKKEFLYISTTNMLVVKKLLEIKKLLLLDITHSNNSNIPEKIKKNLIFWITNLIKTVVVDIISNSNSFIKLLLDADPFIATQKTIPKSINKFTGIVKIKNVNNKNAPIAHIKILLWISSKNIEVNINKLIVKKKRTAKKK